ncbi:HWE histidine kinase domain-containing protein [Phenylobacterium sp.]|uniref:sensor histidine kinase n=1 Tax=Phenylobacterium sp. TaxID=1871053 RepID=UPI002811741B|nr:HWE histidine kinase domain-containing protein [Phenylobacterium sp.]
MDNPPPSSAGAVETSLASVIIENATEYAIFTLDADGQILSWNPGAERILGYSADEALGRNFEMLFVEADRAAGAPRAELRRALAEGRAEDTRWHLRKNGQMFWANGMAMRLGDGQGHGVVKVMRDETASKVADDQRVLLLNELNHRIKNTLATVQAIVEQTLRAAEVEAAVRQSLVERLVALSEAHNVLVNESWAGADLATIVVGALAPYNGGDERFHIEGPPVRLRPQQAVAMSLVLHELTTNAIKYGALSVDDGAVSITWNIAYSGEGARHLTLLWRECGGPAVEPPSREGFGTRLIARSFGPTVGGHAQLVYDRAGLQCVLETPLSSAAELPMLAVPGDPSQPGQHRPPPLTAAGVG